jgi:hypothetical protein
VIFNFYLLYFTTFSEKDKQKLLYQKKKDKQKLNYKPYFNIEFGNFGIGHHQLIIIITIIKKFERTNTLNH